MLDCACGTGLRARQLIDAGYAVAASDASPGMVAEVSWRCVLGGGAQIAASDDENQPLVAHSADGIVRLSPGAQWQTVVKEGSAPVYPG